MNREEFLRNKDVSLFVGWLSQCATTLPVNLVIPRSRFVSNAINIRVDGLQDVLNNYRWRAGWAHGGEEFTSENWETTRSSLGQLSKLLITAIECADENNLLRIVEAVFRWGGIRNINVGAGNFIANNENLINYFSNTKVALKLANANLDDVSLFLTNDNAPELMNAMLTKAHALLSEDGLPIYDSRVAGSISTLVELWMKQEKRHEPTSNLLIFKATDRSVRRRVPAEISINNRLVINRGSPDRGTADWISSKIRLGWIMCAVLGKTDIFKKSEGGEERRRMHAFEASLFMIGYDTASLIRR